MSDDDQRVIDTLMAAQRNNRKIIRCAECERLRAELVAVQECERDLLERDIKADDEIERLRAALERIVALDPRYGIAACVNIAREALKDG